MKKFNGILFLSDLDGTLLYNGALSDENKKAAEYFMENGGLFTLATGRAPDFIAKHGLVTNAPVICINGTVIYDEKTGETIKKYFLPQGSTEAAAFAAENFQVRKTVIFPHNEHNFDVYNVSELLSFRGSVHKIVMCFDDEPETLRAQAALREKFGDGRAFERSWQTGLEMRPADGGKGVCLRFLKKLTGAGTAIAAGDFENDISMLKAADISYAPSGACPEAIKAAGRITCSCENNAIAQIIRELDEKISKGLDL
ncbi:MAG: HAD-IIB family hydrolase [Clostridia bacterium]|nr:HAD-IIB family hydrolase [Clostridia bacterium]